jgi:hypothetical protein
VTACAASEPTRVARQAATSSRARIVAMSIRHGGVTNADGGY